MCWWEPCKGLGVQLALLPWLFWPPWAPFGLPYKGFTLHRFLASALNDCACVFMRNISGD